MVTLVNDQYLNILVKLFQNVNEYLLEFIRAVSFLKLFLQMSDDKSFHFFGLLIRHDSNREFANHFAGNDCFGADAIERALHSMN